MPEDEGSNDQDPNPQGNEGSEDDGGDQSGGTNGGQEPVATIRVGDKEYTPDQLAEMATKAGQYDQLLPDYTQKSQRLSEIEKAAGHGETGPNSKQDENKAPYEDPNWKPKDFGELAAALKLAEERGATAAITRLQEQQKAAEQEVADAKKTVDDFVAGVKTKDKDFDEKDFFDYALRHKFPIKTAEDLQAVYSAYAELPAAAKAGEERGRRGRQARQDNVNQPGGGSGKGVDYSDINARGGSLLDKALDAFNRH